MKKIWATTSFFLSLYLFSYADVRIELHSSGETRASELEKTVLTLSEDKLRFDAFEGVAGSLTSSMIFRDDLNLVYNIDHVSRSYTSFSPEELQRMGAQMNVAQQHMQEQLKNIDPEKRAMMEQLLGGVMHKLEQEAPAPKEIKVIETSEKETINGIKAQKHQVEENGILTRELWIASWKDIGMNEQNFSVFQKMAEFYSGLMDQLSDSALGSALSQQASGNPFESLAELNGFPVRSSEIEAGRVVSETNFKQSETIEVDISVYSPPGEYAKQSMY